MEKEYKITVEFTDDGGENTHREFICRGYALIAFEAENESHERGDALVNIMTASIEDIKGAILHDAHFIQAACLAKGEMEARMYAEKVEKDQFLKGVAERMKDLLK